MGEVFAAENIRTGRPVAVKLLRAESKAKSSAVARFRREARAAGSINSDHVTEILDVEEDDEHGICLVFELLEGESLIDRLKRTGPIPYEELHSIIEQVWEGLADAHRAGVIHRDLKPSNVFLEKRPDGTTRVKILDFGISKLPKEMGGETLTEMGQSLGTFSFMPPEQIGKAKTVDHRADIYACATLIYQALSGQLPYAARNILVMVEMKSKTEPRRLSDVMGKDVDPRLEQFLASALARDPDKRFQTAAESLEQWRTLRPGHNGAVGAAAQSGNLSGQTVRDQPQGQGQPAHARGGYPPVAQLPEISESTSDTAATIAIPVQQLMANSPVPGQAGPSSVQPASGQPSSAQGMLQRTLPHLNRKREDSPPRGYEQPPNQQESPFGQTVAMRKDGGRATPAGGTPAAALQSSPGMQNPALQSSPGMQRPAHQSGSGHPTSALQSNPSLPDASPPTEDDDVSTAGPASQELTQVYRPKKSQPSAADIKRRDPPRSALSFVIGAIAFALVGFGIVAVVLEYMRTGLLPWQ